MPYANVVTYILPLLGLGIGLILCLDGLFLVAQRKITIGTVLPVVIGLIFILHALFYSTIDEFLSSHELLKRVWQLAWLLFFCWFVSLLWFFYLLASQRSKTVLERPVSAIIILGSGVHQGQPSELLSKRLDQAALVFKSSPQSLIVVTGGIDFGEDESEAAVMARYLNQHYAIALSQMVFEDQSTSTELNLENSKPLLRQRQIQPDAPIAIVTSDFHRLRAAAIARKQGYQNVRMVGAATPLSMRYNAWLREYFAFVSGWVLREY